MSTDRFNLLERSSRLECVGSLELSTLLPPPPPIFFQPLRQPEVGDAHIWRRPQALPDRQEACGSKARQTLRLWLRVWSSISHSPVSFNTWGAAPPKGPHRTGGAARRGQTSRRPRVPSRCSESASRTHPPGKTLRVHPTAKTMRIAAEKPGMGVEPTGLSCSIVLSFISSKIGR
jgi:hypothetical protein